MTQMTQNGNVITRQKKHIYAVTFFICISCRPKEEEYFFIPKPKEKEEKERRKKKQNKRIKKKQKRKEVKKETKEKERK